MKRITLILLTLSMLFCLASCGQAKPNDTTPQDNTGPNTETEVAPPSDTESESGTTQPSEAEEVNKTLVVYFSASGNTEKVASYIAENLNADIFELVPVEPYTDDDLNWRKAGSRVNREHDDPALQNIELEQTTAPHWENYDTVFIGYPLWWRAAAWPVNTFIKANDFTGKTVIPFCTSQTDGFGDSGAGLEDMAGTGTWLEGIRFHENPSEEDVKEWVNGLNLDTAANTSHFPDALVSIPEAYMGECDQPGQLQDLYYDTYESFSYAEKTQKLTKRAVVYLPYGYDETQQYPVFYLMHGGWSDETAYLGTPENPRGMKNILDHGIANGEIVPMIVVCPTYNNTSPEDSGDYSLALQLTNNYHNELVNDLIPAVDSTYSTIADREHRAFCGFSMGSMTTWRTFQYCLEQFRYFMPSSGGPAMSANDYTNIIENAGYDWDDFFIFAASGTNDFAYSGFRRGIDTMAQTNPFRFANNELDGNLYYLESDGDHSGYYAMLYFYNGLRWIWK